MSRRLFCWRVDYRGQDWGPGVQVKGPAVIQVSNDGVMGLVTVSGTGCERYGVWNLPDWTVG